MYIYMYNLNINVQYFIHNSLILIQLVIVIGLLNLLHQWSYRRLCCLLKKLVLINPYHISEIANKNLYLRYQLTNN
jgi:hypothetical protein